MLRAAEDRLSDSEILASSATSTSDSSYLLHLLAFEILLKAAHLVHVGPPPKGHDYPRLFQALPNNVQSELRGMAELRMGPNADYSSLAKILSRFAGNFVALRYEYEVFEDLSDEEVAQRGRQWLERGAPLEGADFVFYPEELFGLSEALRAHLKGWLGPSD